MIESQSLAEAAITQIQDAPDLDALERVRRDFVGEDEGRIHALLATAHESHQHHVLDAIRRVEEALRDRATQLEKHR